MHYDTSPEAEAWNFDCLLFMAFSFSDTSRRDNESIKLYPELSERLIRFPVSIMRT